MSVASNLVAMVTRPPWCALKSLTWQRIGYASLAKSRLRFPDLSDNVILWEQAICWCRSCCEIGLADIIVFYFVAYVVSHDLRIANATGPSQCLTGRTLVDRNMQLSNTAIKSKIQNMTTVNSIFRFSSQFSLIAGIIWPITNAQRHLA